MNIIRNNKQRFKGLIEITEAVNRLRELNEKIDLRNERSWYNDLYDSLSSEPERIELYRTLITQDLEILRFDYQIMELKENIAKSDRQ